MHKPIYESILPIKIIASCFHGKRAIIRHGPLVRNRDGDAGSLRIFSSSVILSLDDDSWTSSMVSECVLETRRIE